MWPCSEKSYEPKWEDPECHSRPVATGMSHGSWEAEEKVGKYVLDRGIK